MHRITRCGDPLDNRMLVPISFRAYGEGDLARGDSLFARALADAPSDSVRADFLYARGAGRYGSPSDFARALEYHPTHGPSLYRTCGLRGDRVGRPTTTRGRLAYWCLADCYQGVADQHTLSEQIRRAASRAAAQYERAGPTPEQIASLGLVSGEVVEVDMGEAGTCTTTVR